MWDDFIAGKRESISTDLSGEEALRSSKCRRSDEDGHMFASEILQLMLRHSVVPSTGVTGLLHLRLPTQIDRVL